MASGLSTFGRCDYLWSDKTCVELTNVVVRQNHVRGSPSNSFDGLIEIEAEDIHNFKERLADIKIPTLVIGGEKDSLYPIAETAAGIQNAKLILYKGVRHLAMMKSQFSHDIVAFLTEDSI